MKDEAHPSHLCWWKGWGVKDEAVILHRGSFRRECGEGLGCHPSQGVLVEGLGGEG